MTGVLALQGAFAEHIAMLTALGEPCVEIRQRSDLARPLDGLILPGGESTVMRRLLRDLELLEPLRAAIAAGLPVFGTCAGLILLAREIEGEPEPVFAAMDVRVRRNAYGRQLSSFSTTASFADVGCVPMVFIRAPYIAAALSPSVQVLAETGGHIVAARQGNCLATAFHPELTSDTRVHAYFLQLIHARS